MLIEKLSRQLKKPGFIKSFALRFGVLFASGAAFCLVFYFLNRGGRAARPDHAAAFVAVVFFAISWLSFLKLDWRDNGAMVKKNVSTGGKSFSELVSEAPEKERDDAGREKNASAMLIGRPVRTVLRCDLAHPHRAL